MNFKLDESEISQINDLIRNQPERYLFDLSIRPSNKSLRKLTEILEEDFGKEFALRATSNPLFGFLGIRSLYSGLYHFSLHTPPEFVSVGLFASEVERGPIDYIKFGKHTVLVKSYQGKQEPKIVKLASELEIGPRIYGPGVELVEDYLGEKELPHKHPFEIGRMVGELLRKFHDAGIIYADNFMGHLRYDMRGEKLRLFDFGVSFVYDSSRLIDEDYLWRVVGLMDGPMTFSQLGEILDDPDQATRYQNISADEIKEKEFERMKNEVIASFRFPVQFGGFRLYLRNQFQEELLKGITECYRGHKK